MSRNHVKASNKSSAAGNDLYSQCVFGSPSFLEQYNITDLSSAMTSLLSELKNERKMLLEKIAKTAILDGTFYFCFFDIGGCALYVVVHSLTTQKTYYPVILIVFSVLLAGILFLLRPLRIANQAERMQEKKVDATYQVLGRLQEEQIWEKIRGTTLPPG